jgi:hypothetical protein
MTVSFSRTRTHSAACTLDRRMHTSPRTLRKTGRAKTAYSSFHGCTLLRAAQLSGFHCTRPHQNIPRHQQGPRYALAVTRTRAGADLSGVRRTMTGSDDDAPAARGPPLGARARRSEAANLHAPVVLLIFQDSPSSHPLGTV